jgi:hypothetical protein
VRMNTDCRGCEQMAGASREWNQRVAWGRHVPGALCNSPYAGMDIATRGAFLIHRPMRVRVTAPRVDTSVQLRAPQWAASSHQPSACSKPLGTAAASAAPAPNARAPTRQHSRGKQAPGGTQASTGRDPFGIKAARRAQSGSEHRLTALVPTQCGGWRRRWGRAHCAGDSAASANGAVAPSAPQNSWGRAVRGPRTEGGPASRRHAVTCTAEHAAHC